MEKYIYICLKAEPPPPDEVSEWPHSRPETEDLQESTQSAGTAATPESLSQTAIHT